jgi:hypothetical protein
VCGRAVHSRAVIAFEKRSPNMTAIWALVAAHSPGASSTPFPSGSRPGTGHEADVRLYARGMSLREIASKIYWRTSKLSPFHFAFCRRVITTVDVPLRDWCVKFNCEIRLVQLGRPFYWRHHQIPPDQGERGGAAELH